MFEFNENSIDNFVQSESGYSAAPMLGGVSHPALESAIKSYAQESSSVIDFADVLSDGKMDLLLSGESDNDEDGGRVFRGTRGDDELEGDYRDLLLGYRGNDILNTLEGRGYNILEGGPGNDELEANHHDTLIGGSGDDELSTNEGNGFNILKGGEGDDELEGNHHDTLSGGKDDDLLSTAEGNGYNVLKGDSGDDELEGNHHDELSGGTGDDTLSTADGDGYNVLKGGQGNDIVRGGHHDVLYGNSGDDYIEFYGGNNVAYGGQGADLFELADGELPDGLNTIKDFKDGVDKLQIRNIEGLNSFEDLTFEQEGKHVVVSFEDQELAVLEKVRLDRIDADDFIIDPRHTPDISAADFNGAVIDNPYLPFVPGTKWVYEGMTDEGLERQVVEVLDETRMINGVEATVVRDTVYVNGEIREDTYDWYAQDLDGNVWYLGEFTTAYEDGQPLDTHGSFEWGVDGALPGIVMFADPSAHIDETYKQELYIGEAEDTATLLSTSDSVTVPYGTFTNVVKTFEFTPLEPFTKEHKFYVEGIGFIKQVNLRTGEELDLVEFVGPTV
ncbi:MAG: hypothetical protein KA099_00915 [Alphaproteobacteria bacterium]|nr:hypothetical protein [Alphaproteobacteria bacterium]MBP7758343.1 hypothetical protein [Alphaproteobacteria bacterium]MBP7762338.1 hypothetical protein [Alphaproteobacteria bacterium]MBP7903861.1 hypothetical protein [Alphaproteobacteria bacterium]